jgi:putative addiction module component (TIGR02574 family)
MNATINGLTPAAKNLLPDLDALPTSDRELLATYLLSPSEPAENEVEVRAAWKAEILRRVEEIRNGKVVGIPFEEVDKKIREKYG